MNRPVIEDVVHILTVGEVVARLGEYDQDQALVAWGAKGTFFITAVHDKRDHRDAEDEIPPHLVLRECE